MWKHRSSGNTVVAVFPACALAGDHFANGEFNTGDIEADAGSHCKEQ